jgi:hypothetical protein
MKKGLLCVIAGLATIALAATARAAETLFVWRAAEIATGPGEKGPWRQNDSRYRYVDDPTVALDDNGVAYVAWVDQSLKDVLFRRVQNDSRTSGRPLNVSRNPDTFSWLPRIALAPNAPQRVYLLWQEIIFSGGSHGGDVLFARSNDGGASFSTPLNLSNSIGGDGKGRINRDVWHNGSYDLAAGQDDDLYLVWTEYEGRLWFAHSNDGGSTFTPPRHIAGNQTMPARAPALAIGDDVVFVAWTHGEDNAADIHVARSTDRGASFGKPVIAATTRDYSDAPKLAVDPRGMLHLVFAESVGGPFDRYHIRYTRSRDGLAFDTPRPISEPVPKEKNSAPFPAMRADASGHLYVVWELAATDRTRPRGLGFAASFNGGESFTRPILVPHSTDPAGGHNGSQQGLLMQKLAVNAAGSIAIVNSSLKENRASRVWLIRAERRDAHR